MGLENKYSMADFRSRHCSRPDSDAAARRLRQPLALDRRRDRVSHVPAEPAVEYPASFSVPRVAGQYPPQRAGCSARAAGIFRAGDTGHAAAHLPIWLAGLWFFFSRQGQSVSRAGLGVGFHGGRGGHRDEPAHLLSVPGVPVLFAGGRRDLGNVAGARTHVAEIRLSGSDRRDRSDARAIAIPLLPPRPTSATPSAAPAATQNRNSQAGSAAAALCRPVRMGGDDGNGRGRLQPSAGRHPRPDRDLRAELRAGRRHRPVRPKYGLPPAISGHQSYFLWGPRNYTGESIIVLGDNQRNLERVFTSAEKVGHIDHPYSMPYNHVDVYYCRGLKQPLAALWPKVKAWN